MRCLTYADWPSYPIVFLVPTLRSKEIRQEYLDSQGIPADDARVLPLHFTGKKTPLGEMKRYVVEELVPALQCDPGIRYLVVADAGYYKLLSGQPQAEANLGYVRDCAFGPWKVVYVPSVRSVFYDPEKVRAKIAQSLQALVAHANGTYQDPGDGVVHFEAYPKTDEEIRDWLNRLLAMDRPLAIDIEGFSLKHHRAGIGTISFAWSKHEGIAFPVDYVPVEGATEAPFGTQVRNQGRRDMLLVFFTALMKKTLYHNISYDVYVLIYELFMEHVLDTKGLLAGMDVLLRDWDDTQIITYLATNSCSGNELGLKANSQEFSGNYAVDKEKLEDIRTVPLDELLRYNLVDALSTWYVYEKYWDKMVADQQLEVYEQLFKPTTLDIIQMQLTGLPLNMQQVRWVKHVLQEIEADALRRIQGSPIAQQFTYRLNEQWVTWKNSTLKKKRVSIQDGKEQFNPNSGPQLQDLLYEMLGLPVLDLTDSKQPATGGDTLEKLVNHTQDQGVKDFLQALLDHGAVYKLLTSFIPAFEDAMVGPDGWHYLVGSFRLGGTISGRLSSRNPNMQNLPANVQMAISPLFLKLFPELKQFVKKGKLSLGKLMKSCFQAPPGWVFLGLDFSSLEDRISALTTRDPNKLKVYTDGYDGHSLRAYAYFSEKMPDIDPTSVESINSIQDKYPKERQDSKPPTFALTYQGTWSTLVKNNGFKEALAKQVEARFKELYKVSIRWVQDRLDQAGRDGYITGAFGLRIRTPLLEQVIRGNSKTPREAEAEGRTAGNALGQSWCLLNERASVEFMARVRREQHRLDIRPCAHIHDAQYYLVREDVDTILYVNEHLVRAVQWQEHPEIRNDEVHLGGNLSIFWPSWADEIEVPNGVDAAGLFRVLGEKLERTA